jgi:hypothetical protein
VETKRSIVASSSPTSTGLHSTASARAHRSGGSRSARAETITTGIDAVDGSSLSSSRSDSPERKGSARSSRMAQGRSSRVMAAAPMADPTPGDGVALELHEQLQELEGHWIVLDHQHPPRLRCRILDHAPSLPAARCGARREGFAIRRGRPSRPEVPRCSGC